MYYSFIFSFKVILKQLPDQFQTQIVFQLQMQGNNKCGHLRGNNTQTKLGRIPSKEHDF